MEVSGSRVLAPSQPILNAFQISTLEIFFSEFPS